MLLESIESDFKTAFKAKDEVGKSALSNLKAAVKNAEVDKGSALTDDEVLLVITKKVKQHKDSITSFEAGNRADLANNEKAQMAVLQKYLPAQLTEDDIRKIVLQVINQTNATAKDFGTVMKAVTAKTKSAADGSLVSKIVKENLK